MIASSPAPRITLFLSADIVGSTAYKVASLDTRGRPHWLEAFETLFGELPLVFIGQVAAAGLWREHVPECGVWKVLGDEVIFIGLPVDVEEAEILTSAFVRTVETYDLSLASRWPLRVRGACWAAEMGDRNRMIEIPEMFSGEKGRPYRDYLGPDVDLGFRLSAHSAPGRVIISPNLAEALVSQPEPPKIAFHLAGERALKGVGGGRPIPLILASCPRESDAPADQVPGCALAPLPPLVDPGHLRNQLASHRSSTAEAHYTIMAPLAFPSGSTVGG